MRQSIVLLPGFLMMISVWAGLGRAEDLATILQDDLAQAAAGDRIDLAPGDYGSVHLHGLSFDKMVTLNAHGEARFDQLYISEVRNLRLSGIRVEAIGGRSAVRIMQSQNVEIVDADISGPLNRVAPVNAVKFGIEIRDQSEEITVANSYIHDVLNGIGNFGTARFTLADNRIDYIGADAFKFGAVSDGIIRNNIGPTHFYPSEDTHADFMQFQGTPSKNLEITGNILLLHNRFDMQGIFFGGEGGHSTLSIRQNIIYTRMANGIRVKDGKNISVQDNTLINAFSAKRPVTRISVPSGAIVQSNIVSGKKGALKYENIVMQHLEPKGRFYYSDLFTGLQEGQPITIYNLRPVQGSPAESYGAHTRLMELQNDG